VTAEDEEELLLGARIEVAQMDDRRHDHVERSAVARAQVVRVRAERRQEVRPPEQLRDLRKAAAASMGTARQSDTQREGAERVGAHGALDGLLQVGDHARAEVV
jgi:hypothetical protein